MDLSSQISQAVRINRNKLTEVIQESRRITSGQTYRLGIMGGTFDPIHYGHLVTAENAQWLFGLKAVVFIPSGLPPHKKAQSVSDSEHRYNMTLLATAGNPFFGVSRLEIDRPGYSYTVDTVKEILKKVGLSVDLFFISGADAILEILSWKNVFELLDLCTFVAATRPGFDLSDPELHLHLPDELIKKIETIEVPSMAISSTEIRNRVKAGEPIRYLLPKLAEHYIKRFQLYKDLL